MEINLNDLFFIRNCHTNFIDNDDSGEIWWTKFEHIAKSKCCYGDSVIKYAELREYEKRTLLTELQWDKVIGG